MFTVLSQVYRLNCNIKLRENVQVMEIRGSEGREYDYFVRGRVPEFQS